MSDESTDDLIDTIADGFNLDRQLLHDYSNSPEGRHRRSLVNGDYAARWTNQARKVLAEMTETAAEQVDWVSRLNDVAPLDLAVRQVAERLDQLSMSVDEDREIEGEQLDQMDSHWRALDIEQYNLQRRVHELEKNTWPGPVKAGFALVFYLTLAIGVRTVWGWRGWTAANGGRSGGS